MECPLCHSSNNTPLDDIYSECHLCGGIYMDKIHYVDAQSERGRYEEHHNNPDDPNYRQFVSPITDYVLNNFSLNSIGLDFGSGTGPVISKILQENNYQIFKYDPFFAPDVNVLSKKYDYIASCEVIEHFHQPDKEFKSLYEMLVPGGKLLCMTKLYNDKIPFKNWYYRRDPTHVFIYQAKTISFISEQFGFKTSLINTRLIVFQK